MILVGTRLCSISADVSDVVSYTNVKYLGANGIAIKQNLMGLGSIHGHRKMLSLPLIQITLLQKKAENFHFLKEALYRHLVKVCNNFE